MTEERKQATLSVAVIGLKLLLICVAVAGVISFVFSLTSAKYEENLKKEKESAIAKIFAAENLNCETAPGNESLYVVKEGDTAVGYCVEVSSNGFGGEMNLMVGFNADGTVRGVQIVALSETPGLGARVNDDAYLSQYQGKSGEMQLGTDVDAITGATISSKAVLSAVNKAVETVAPYLE